MARSSQNSSFSWELSRDWTWRPMESARRASCAVHDRSSIVTAWPTAERTSSACASASRSRAMPFTESPRNSACTSSSCTASRWSGVRGSSSARSRRSRASSSLR